VFDWLVYCFAPVEFVFFRVLVKPVLKLLYPQEVAWDEFDWIILALTVLLGVLGAAIGFGILPGW
jgi:hypothetical protein